MARRLGLSAETVRTHTKGILARLQARDRAHAVAIALRTSLIEYAGPRDRPAGLDPAAVAGDEHGLRAVHRADLAVDVVEVGADRAHRERQLLGDLLVDLALGEPAQRVDLAIRERTGIGVAPDLSA